MGNALVGLATALVGVTGTLVVAVLSHRSLARVQTDQFERQRRLTEVQWLREQEKAELDRRRDCYMNVNAVFRRYRTQLMNFLWLIQKAEVTPEAREALEEARREHHSAFAEAQMIASGSVLAELDGMSGALSDMYRRIMCLDEGDPDPDGSFDEIRTVDFHHLYRRWDRMRAVMRTDLGVGAGGTSAAAPVRT
ncbi:hypothetical protein ABZ924_26990 [Streptomyces sp. NPDC046876]|uniref:hypothetical protein n=1 Tax=Streptomyces sp. NPDC046876 TaxID=3155616 RepID=UPI0033F81687